MVQELVSLFSGVMLKTVSIVSIVTVLYVIRGTVNNVVMFVL